MAKYCMNCGAALRETAKFCAACGTAAGTAPAAKAPAAAQSALSPKAKKVIIACTAALAVLCALCCGIAAASRPVSYGVSVTGGPSVILRNLLWWLLRRIF